MRSSLFCLVLLSCATWAGQATAQNLLTNGSFETGDFTGWTATGNVQVQSGVSATDGTSAAVFNPGSSLPTGRLSQTFTATVGEAYQLRFDSGATAYNFDQVLNVEIKDSTGRILAASGFNGSGGRTSNYLSNTAIFVATTTQMTLVISDHSNLPSAEDGLLNNVIILPLTDFSLWGVYTGSEEETMSFSKAGISNVRKMTVKMQIDHQGRMLILQNPFFEYSTGTINDSGDVTLGDEGEFPGKAVFRGPATIEFQVTESRYAGGNFDYTGIVVTRKFVVHRVGPLPSGLTPDAEMEPRGSWAKPSKH